MYNVPLIHFCIVISFSRYGNIVAILLLMASPGNKNSRQGEPLPADVRNCLLLLHKHLLAVYNVDASISDVLDAAACEVVDNLFAILNNYIVN